MRGPNPKDIRERFFAKVEFVPPSDCWIWGGAVDSSGYGRFYNGQKIDGAHRISYILHNGPIPTGLFVCHHCDVKLCVNPAHLFVGTNSDNLRDAVRKDKFHHQDHRGTKNPNAKLNAVQVAAIRAAASTHTRVALAKQYGVQPAAISKIILRQHWD